MDAVAEAADRPQMGDRYRQVAEVPLAAQAGLAATVEMLLARQALVATVVWVAKEATLKVEQVETAALAVTE